MRRRLSLYSLPYVIWSALLILLPILLVFVFSVRESSANKTPGELTLRGYAAFLDPLYLNILGFTLLIAGGATFICLILAYPIALCINREGETTRRNIMLMLMIPMWINFLIKTYAWKPILRQGGPVDRILQLFGGGEINLLYSKGAILLGLVYNFLPYMILPILNSLNRIDRPIIDAAGDLGADWIKTQRKVIIPLVMPGVFSGITMVFLPSASTFLIPVILGGGKHIMIGNLVERQFLKTGDLTFGSAISMILLLVIFLIMIIMNRLNRRAEEAV